MTLYEKGILPQDESRILVRNYTEYNMNIFSFDVETSSGYIKNNRVIPFKKGKQKEYEKYDKVALLYMWQFGINDIVYYGRCLDTFMDLLDELQSKYLGEKIIWVHNLSFEFHWLINVIPFQKVFAKKARRVICSKINTITFRCTYFLTHRSLENWAIDAKLPVEKLVDTVDYTVLRTPKTTLSDDILKYGEIDCLVIYYGIKQYADKYKNIHNIPLTQTGEVRAIVKKILKSYKHHKKMTELLPKNAYEYASLRACFAGGATHANWTYAGEVMTNVNSKDLGSAYPTVMCVKKFPYSKFEKVESFEGYNNEDYSAILDVTFYEIESVILLNYISSSKCYYLKNAVLDNGKIMKASELRIICTNIDYNIIKKCYKCKKEKFNDIQIAINQYLPREFILYILKLYGDKTSLKGLIEEYGNYMASKQYINALYGMLVSAIIHDEIKFDDGEWITNTATIQQINDGLDDLRDKPYKNFLAYMWGVWVTAYVRENLFSVITQIHQDVLYHDTDCVKYINNHDDVFKKFNEKLIKEIEQSAKANNIPLELFKPKDSKGNEHMLGIFENDDGVPYQEFKTLGAKRYAYRDNNGALHMTVSGVNKEKGVKSLKDDINNFTDDLKIKEEYSKKLTMTYLDDMPKITWNKGQYDEYTCSLQHAVHAEPATYTLGITLDYLFLIGNDTLDNFEEYTAEELHELIESWKKDQKRKSTKR